MTAWEAVLQLELQHHKEWYVKVYGVACPYIDEVEEPK